MTHSSLLFGAVADDLTGGVELASTLVTQGIRTEMRVGSQPDKPDDRSTAVVVALKSRVALQKDAKAKFGAAVEWLRRSAARQLFFKYCATFDSTPEGNIGCCADAMMDLTGADRMIFCPSFPNRRTVYNGHLFVEDHLVSDSPKRFDPLTPMTEPDLRKVLAPQTARRVGLLPWRITAKGPGVMAGHVDDLVRSGCPYIIADAISAEDLAAIAELTVDWPLMSGNSTIAGYYPAVWRRQGLLEGQDGPATLGRVDGPGVVLAGSCAEQTLEQLETFKRSGRPVLSIDLLDAIAGTDVVGPAIEWAHQRMLHGEVGVTTAAPVQKVSEVQDRIGRTEAGQLAEDILARIAVGLTQRGLKRLVVAGGETSGAVISALGISQMLVGPHETGSIPLAQADFAGGIGLCLKSGKLGPEDIFMDRLRAMQNGAAS
jgi:uncharacterized protein YgbK (DUF1537 family)